MENKTVQYKRTLRGSVGAGMSALMNGSGRRFFILEHKDASKFHKAGESQKIIIDQVELGRGSDCQVRFDETFDTVSRRHAAIVRENDRWKLVQLSTTNSTFLNGRKIETEWYLENGDEIQLAVNGPRLGFIMPAGKQSLVSSIKMTERLELFRKQALAPYKRAIACLAILLVLLSVGAGYVIHSQGEDIKAMLVKITTQEKLLADVNKRNAQDRKKIDSLKNVKPKVIKQTVVVNKIKNEDVREVIEKVKTSVYAVVTTSYFVNSEGKKEVIEKSQGTGFLMEDGRFVTARHCVEPWLFSSKKDALQLAYAYANTVGGNVRVYASIYAINSNGDQIEVTDKNFHVDRSYDSQIEVPWKPDENEDQITLIGCTAFGTKASLGNDWAYVRVSKQGKIRNGANMSTSLKGGTPVHLLGFPKGKGILDGSKIVEPIYNSMSVSRDGLNEDRCIMVSQGIDHGNSGGPVFYIDKGIAYVIGIVSRGDDKSDFYNQLVPMANIK